MSWGWRIAGIFFTFNLVCFGWLMFRAESMQTVSLMLHQIFSNFNLAVAPQVLKGYLSVFLLMGAGYALHMLPPRPTARPSASSPPRRRSCRSCSPLG